MLMIHPFFPFVNKNGEFLQQNFPTLGEGSNFDLSVRRERASGGALFEKKSRSLSDLGQQIGFAIKIANLLRKPQLVASAKTFAEIGKKNCAQTQCLTGAFLKNTTTNKANKNFKAN